MFIEYLEGTNTFARLCWIYHLGFFLLYFQVALCIYLYSNELDNLPNKLSERENSSVTGKWECSVRFIFDPIQTVLFENAPSLW